MKRPTITSEQQAQAVEALRALAHTKLQGSRDWANRLRFRELSGERLTPYQRDAWRVALGAVHSAEESDTP